MSQVERVRSIRDLMWAESEAIRGAIDVASAAAAEAAMWVADCHGSVILTGVGKAGWIAQKVVATLASTGSPSHFLHPSEAVHGDLGRVRSGDVVIAFSNSGRSEEVVRACEFVCQQDARLIAITADENNPLANLADLVVPMGQHQEACPLGLAPTSTTAVMLAVGDAIALLASRLKGFTPENFARFHPGGALGRKLTRVDQVMRPLHQCRVAPQQVCIRDAIATASADRRSGAVMLTDQAGRLTGIFTDSDLVKLLQRRRESSLDEPVSDSMTTAPKTVASGKLLSEAIAILSEGHISELPVVDADHRPLGMIDITDLIAAGDIQGEPDRADVPVIPMAEHRS